MSEITRNLLATSELFKTAPGIAASFWKWLNTSPVCRRNKINLSVNFLRWGLGFIYLWFGALKFIPDLSSAEQLAGTTIEIMTFGYLTPNISLPLLALWETAIGLALLTGKFRRTAIMALYFHVAGTFFPLLLLPEQTWHTPLLAASLEGQYIFKNLVTIGAALVINATESCGEASCS